MTDKIQAGPSAVRGRAGLLMVALLSAAVSSVPAARAQSAGGGFNGAARYATDAYPGFDLEESAFSPSRKAPRWFGFLFGPDCDSASAQFAHCQELVANGDLDKAVRQLDALVRGWPTAPEAWKAQQQCADLLFERLGRYEDAFAEYRYLLDFYSLQCNYAAIADRLYQVAGAMRREGKEILFIRFANTVDVRRAYETCVLRAPGAKWAPEAMLTIASLREDEGKLDEAVKVYENLRSLHPDADEAKTAVAREASVRMAILREREYNRLRARDTVDFMTLALEACRPSDAEAIKACRAEAEALIAEEAYRGAKFYDSRMRTRRSAINAYEKFLEAHPESAHAPGVRARLEELKGAER